MLPICKLPFPNGSYRNGVCRALWAMTLPIKEQKISIFPLCLIKAAFRTNNLGYCTFEPETCETTTYWLPDSLIQAFKLKHDVI